MPEIAEVARVVHFLRQHLVGKRVAKASAHDDSNVFGKAGTSGSAVAAALKGRTVVSAGSQGKYFWLVLDKAPHLVMHLGMTGWVHFKGMRSAYTNYYKKMKPGEEDLWPPKFSKLQLETDGPDKVEVAYTDPRRFGRIRLVDCPGDEIRKHSPLVENGPDPVVDADVFTEAYLSQKMRSKRVSVKALLLDQAVISGIGNWVGDEVLYQARLHPEQYCNNFSDDEITRLYEAICDVCRTAVAKLGDSDQFPEHWLFNHRWGKGAANSSRLPNGEKLAFVTVGGRTSCYAPNLQKKSGAVAPGIKEEPLVPDPKRTRSSPPPKEDEDAVSEKQPASKRRRVASKDAKSKANTSGETTPPASELDVEAATKPKPASTGTKREQPQKPVGALEVDTGRRRSGRLRGKAS